MTWWFEFKLGLVHNRITEAVAELSDPRIYLRYVLSPFNIAPLHDGDSHST